MFARGSLSRSHFNWWQYVAQRLMASWWKHLIGLSHANPKPGISEPCKERATVGADSKTAVKCSISKPPAIPPFWNWEQDEQVPFSQPLFLTSVGQKKVPVHSTTDADILTYSVPELIQVLQSLHRAGSVSPPPPYPRPPSPPPPHTDSHRKIKIRPTGGRTLAGHQS